MPASHINDDWLDTTTTEVRHILDFRHERLRPALTLGRFRYLAAAEPLPEMQHDAWVVLVFALGGVQHYQLDDQEVSLRGGQCLRIPPGRRYSTGSWPEQRGELAWLILSREDPSGLNDLGIEPDAAREVLGRLSAPDGPLVFRPPPFLPGFLHGIFEAWPRRSHPLWREIVRNQLAGLVLAAAARAAPHDVTREFGADATPTRIDDVLAWMDEHLRDEVSIDDLVSRSRLSPARFYQAFKERTGTNPKDHLLRLRLEEAVRLLRNQPDRSVIDIAHELGFSSSQYFATVFRRYLGTTPSRLRGQRPEDTRKKTTSGRARG